MTMYASNYNYNTALPFDPNSYQQPMPQPQYGGNSVVQDTSFLPPLAGNQAMVSQTPPSGEQPPSIPQPPMQHQQEGAPRRTKLYEEIKGKKKAAPLAPGKSIKTKKIMDHAEVTAELRDYNEIGMLKVYDPNFKNAWGKQWPPSPYEPDLHKSKFRKKRAAPAGRSQRNKHARLPVPSNQQSQQPKIVYIQGPPGPPGPPGPSGLVGPQAPYYDANYWNQQLYAPYPPPPANYTNTGTDAARVGMESAGVGTSPLVSPQAAMSVFPHQAYARPNLVSTGVGTTPPPIGNSMAEMPTQTDGKLLQDTGVQAFSADANNEVIHGPTHGGQTYGGGPPMIPSPPGTTAVGTKSQPYIPSPPGTSSSAQYAAISPPGIVSPPGAASGLMSSTAPNRGYNRSAEEEKEWNDKRLREEQEWQHRQEENDRLMQQRREQEEKQHKRNQDERTQALGSHIQQLYDTLFHDLIEMEDTGRLTIETAEHQDWEYIWSLKEHLQQQERKAKRDLQNLQSQQFTRRSQIKNEYNDALLMLREKWKLLKHGVHSEHLVERHKLTLHDEESQYRYQLAVIEVNERNKLIGWLNNAIMNQSQIDMVASDVEEWEHKARLKIERQQVDFWFKIHRMVVINVENMLRQPVEKFECEARETIYREFLHDTEEVFFKYLLLFETYKYERLERADVELLEEIEFDLIATERWEGLHRLWLEEDEQYEINEFRKLWLELEEQVVRQYVDGTEERHAIELLFIEGEEAVYRREIEETAMAPYIAGIRPIMGPDQAALSSEIINGMSSIMAESANDIAMESIGMASNAISTTPAHSTKFTDPGLPDTIADAIAEIERDGRDAILYEEQGKWEEILRREMKEREWLVRKQLQEEEESFRQNIPAPPPLPPHLKQKPQASHRGSWDLPGAPPRPMSATPENWASSPRSPPRRREQTPDSNNSLEGPPQAMREWI